MPESVVVLGLAAAVVVADAAVVVDETASDVVEDGAVVTVAGIDVVIAGKTVVGLDCADDCGVAVFVPQATRARTASTADMRCIAMTSSL